MSESPSDRANASADPRMWVDLYGDSLYSFALVRVRNEAAAEDLVQDTFLSALKARSQFTGGSNELTWLTSILKHKIVDYYRRTNRELIAGIAPDEIADDADFQDASDRPGSWVPGREPLAWADDPHDELEKAEFRKYLQSCLDHLPENLARAFVLREMEESPPEIVCNVLGVTATNLRVLMYRARKGLRRCLEMHWLERGKGQANTR